MAAVSQKIPNLLGGVSQQPDPVKLPGQVRAAENVYLDPTFGCRKRPGTKYISTIQGVPEDARWFPIFRDNAERYAVAIYTDPALTLRVWDLTDGSERTVTVSDTSTAYFGGATQKTIEQITVADYTLITNVNTEVSMNTNTSAEATKEALVLIDQVAYNTVYSIDLQKDGTSAPNKVYRAAGVEVIPGSYEVEDGGACSNADAETFTLNSGSKTGLSFRLINQCQAYLAGGNFTEYKIKKIAIVKNPNWGPGLEGQLRYEQYDGFQVQWLYSELYPGEGLAWSSGAAENVTWSRDNKDGSTQTGASGGKVRITEAEQRPGSNARYVSRYKVDVQLLNGGEGWRAGNTVTVSMGGRSFKIRVTKEAFRYIYNSAGTASFSTPASVEGGALDVGSVVSGLTAAVSSINNFSAESAGNVIKISNTAGRDFNLSVRGGVTDKAMTAMKGLARDIADLPTQCFDGYVIKVNNTDDSAADDYYVRFTTESPGIPGAGSWEETVAPGIKTTLNSSTMPQALVRQADGNFTLEPLNTASAFGGWADREVGDETTNPEPTFVDRTISNLFFFANRLGFLSDDAVIMSQPGDYFNFFSQSAIAISDADPIDVTASSTIPAILKAAVGTPKGLVLFAERSQFLLATSEIAFSSATLKLTEISNYVYRSEVQPLNSGISIAFGSESSSYSKIMELAVDSVENRPAVAEITRIIPQYIPSNLSWGEVFPNSSMLVYGDGSDSVYVFKFFNNGDERQLAGWTRWTYPGQVKLFASEDDLVHIILYDGYKHILCRSEITDDPTDSSLDVGFSSFAPRLDVTLDSSALTLTPVNGNISRFYFTDDQIVQGSTYTHMVTDGDYKGLFTNHTPEYDSVEDSWYIEVASAVAGETASVGIQYIASVVLPAIFVTGDGKADRVHVPQVSFLYLDLYYSGRYRFTVNKLGYDAKVIDLEVPIANSYDADSVPLDEISTLPVPIFSSGDILSMQIEAPDPFPSALTGYSWEGTYNNRGIRALN